MFDKMRRVQKEINDRESHGFIPMTKEKYKKWKGYSNMMFGNMKTFVDVIEDAAELAKDVAETVIEAKKKDNMSETQKKIDIMQAYEDGKKIQHRPLDPYTNWEDCGLFAWNFMNYEYRIKPEPKKVPLTEVDMTPTTWLKCANRVINVTSFDDVYVTVDRGARVGATTLTYQFLMEDNWQISTSPTEFVWKPCYKEV